ncbi:MAG TPA: hypothetical protein VH188_03285 [Chthoniobacterales bacterium]|jgi:hypothetical protein|nr:hypothetical protein [Chthoniobacterales bacterium]
MASTIRLGVPEMETLWNELLAEQNDGKICADRARLLKRLRKTFGLLALNPRHPSLQSHDIDALSKRYGHRVWQSYLENQTPAAGRIFWVYGPERHDITIIGVEPHPDDTKSAYEKVVLSSVRISTSSPGGKQRKKR